jgi:hypothetical protein
MSGPDRAGSLKTYIRPVGTTRPAQSRHPATIYNAAMRPSIADIRVARKSGLVSTPDGAAVQVNWQIS